MQLTLAVPRHNPGRLRQVVRLCYRNLDSKIVDIQCVSFLVTALCRFSVE